MRKLQILALTALLSVAYLANCTWYTWSWTSGNQIKDFGELETKKITITGVSSIHASSIGNLTIEHCPTCEETLTVTADKNVLPHIKTDRDGNQLELYLEGNISTQTPVNYHVVVKSLTTLSASGAVHVKTQNTIREKLLKIKMSGATKMNATIEVEQLTADCSGASKATLTGSATNQTIEISGSSTYNASELQSDSILNTASGSSKACLFAQQQLNGRASGASQTTYRGNAQNNIKTSGAARVRKV